MEAKKLVVLLMIIVSFSILIPLKFKAIFDTLDVMGMTTYQTEFDLLKHTLITQIIDVISFIFLYAGIIVLVLITKA